MDRCSKDCLNDLTTLKFQVIVCPKYGWRSFGKREQSEPSERTIPGGSLSQHEVKGSTVASISKDKRGNRSIQFIGTDRERKRKTVRVGKCSQRQAEAVKVHVERLVHAKITGHPPDADTARWLTTIDDKLADRLARVGLIDKRDASTLKEYLDAYVASRTDVKPGTRTQYGQACRHLLNFFPAEKQLASFTPGDADAWRLHLRG